MTFSSVFKENNLITHWLKRAACISRSLVLTDLKPEPLCIIRPIFQSIPAEIQNACWDLGAGGRSWVAEFPELIPTAMFWTQSKF